MNENVAIDRFVLNFGCTDALEEIKEREYEPHAKMDAKNTFSFIECIQDFYNKIFNQEQNAVSDMIKTDPKKMMHLVVTKISYKESRQDPVKVYQIVAAATFYINKKMVHFWFMLELTVEKYQCHLLDFHHRHPQYTLPNSV
jgi:hypothetical protein